MLLKTSYKMKPPVSARLIPGHPLADKMIACYLLNEGSGVKAHDSSGRGHHGTLTGGATWTMGKYGPAVDLDGTDGHIEIADHADFTPTLSPLSISADVYMHDATACAIASKGDLGTDGEWVFYVHAEDLLRFLAIDESEAGAYIGRQSAAITSYENQWVHLVGTYSGGAVNAAVRLYLNALRNDISNATGGGVFVAVENLAGVMKIGKERTSFADGIFDNLMIWRRVLTASDIAKLHINRFCMFERRARLAVAKVVKT